MISIFLTLKCIVNHNIQDWQECFDSRLPEGGTVTGTVFTGDTDLLCSLGLKRNQGSAVGRIKRGRAGIGVGYVGVGLKT